jgi:hypothetical protein
MLIVTRTAAAAAKVIESFLMRPPTYCVDARVDEWCKHRVTSGILSRSGAVVETPVSVMQRIQGQVGGRGYLHLYRISAPPSSPH